MKKKDRVLSGTRPTGKLHWGNYFGAIKNWVELQEKYDSFFFIADWHALTTDYDRPEKIYPAVREVMLDWLACGVDPKKATLFIQSWVGAHAELHLLLSMVTPLGWLERVPSFKDMQQELKDRDLNMYGFLGYPLLQTADILLYRAKYVPVGEDQLAHLELSREVVRRFHHLMKKDDIFIEPQPLLTPTPRVPGIDGRKMSKSFQNAIYIADDEKTITEKMMQTLTDPARVRRQDPGNPEICNIFHYHKLFSDKETVAYIDRSCRTAAIGCVECKKICIENALKFWRPFHERRKLWEGREKDLLKMLRDGSEHATKAAHETMESVREAMGMRYK